MEQHLRILGLRRDSSDVDVKKAYRQKALEYHPDRNPTGGEQFKLIQIAYEALLQQWKTHGTLLSWEGPSKPPYDTGFRDANGEVRRYPFRPFRQATTDPAAFDETHAQAEAHRKKAHGSRVPVSGYDPFSGESDELNAFVSQAKQFAEMERKKASLADFMKQCKGATEGKKTNEPFQPSHQRLSDEWNKKRQEMEQEETTRREIDEAERRSRKQKIDQETREEWERMQAEIAAKQSEQSARKNEEEAMATLQQERKTAMYLKELQAERRELKQELFTRRIPDESELQRMSDLELHVLDGVLRRTLEALGRNQRSRDQNRHPCTTCNVAPRSATMFFSCAHKCICPSCSIAAEVCPVCGADKRP